MKQLVILPDWPYTIFESQGQEIGEIYVVQKRRLADFEASKLWNGRLGNIKYI